MARLSLGKFVVFAFFTLTACGGPSEVGSDPEPGASSGTEAPADEVVPLVAANAGTTPECVAVSGRAIYGALAYNHWVYIDNGCEQSASCTVRTDVAPDSIEVEVAAGAREEVTTFLGATASEFTPNVDCQLR